MESVEIRGNQIVARVAGSRRIPYDVRISVPPFTPEEKSMLTRSIMENTLLLTRLLNRELPPELETLSLAQHICIFPESFNDLELTCSCPDWAVPCKHLAAVIYVMAGEIDKNPFLIFQIHDYDLIQALEERHWSVNQAAHLKITDISELLTPEPVVPDTDAREADIDYSLLPALQNKILTLLSARPLFFEKDFKIILKTTYAAMAKTGRYGTPEAPASDFSEFTSVSNISIVMDDQFSLKQVSVYGEDQVATTADLGLIFHRLESLEPKMRMQLYPVLYGMAELLLFTSHCLEKSTLIPQLISAGKKVRIRWIPALMNETVKMLFDAIVPLVSYPIISMEERDGRLSYMPVFEQALTLFSLIVHEFIQESNIYEDLKWRYASSRLSHKILELFFDQGSVLFDSYQEKETPQTIQQWLSKLYMSHRNYIPVIRIVPEENCFIVDLQVENRDRSAEPVPLYDFLNDPVYQDSKFEVLRDLSMLAEYFPQLSASIGTQGRERISFHARDFTSILLEILPVIRMFGIRILMPMSLKTLIRPRISLQLKRGREQAGLQAMGLDRVLSFDWKVALGNQLIGFDEFREAVQDSAGLVKIRDQYVLIDQKEIDRLLRRLNHPPELSSEELLKTALTETYEDAPVGLSPEIRDWLKAMTETGPVSLPEDLKACLRPYQEVGFSWMIKNSRFGFGSLLADDMGLGKTLQVLTVLLHFKGQGMLNRHKALVIVPTTLITNWVKEIEMFTPGLKPFVYYGQNRRFNPKEHDLVITSYGILRSELKRFQNEEWYALIIDEAQNIKNPLTAQTRAVKKIRAAVKIAMSGTPVENRLSEYWSILDFTNKGILGSLKRFNEEFAKPIQMDHSHEKIDRFQKLTGPFILRRVKTNKEIIHDLPEKIENAMYCNLTPVQAALYQSTVNNTMEQIEAMEGFARRGLVFRLMTALKQICNHPFHYLKSGARNPEASGKLSLLWNILDTIYENNEKVLIFTQYREMGDLLTYFIHEKYRMHPLFLHGGTQRKNRDKMVETFQNQLHAHTFILSLKAGGTGLNLTAAQNVIHYDLWWNPAVENQATDRAHRIGQTRNVMVYRLLTEGTFEEKINEMLQNKKWLAEAAVAVGEKWIGDLSDRELRDLVRLE